VPLLVRRLEKDDLVNQFDCGDQALNDYLKRFAWQNQNRHSVGVTYVAAETEVPRAVIGYHTLASSSIPKASFPGNAGQRLSPYHDVPVVLLARLAVDRRFQQRGVGQTLLRHALELSLAVREQVGCRCVLVDAYPSAVPWYGRFGFVPIGGAPAGVPTQKMFLDLRTVEAAILRE
jgi:GNAT superfamily N-acetyltransferase